MSQEKENQLDSLGLGFSISPELLGGGSGVVVAMGTKVSTRMLEKYKGTEEGIDRVAFIIDTPIVIKFHYFGEDAGNMGYIQCFNGDCCEFDPSPAKVRYLFPIIKYHSNQKGACSVDCDYEVQVLSAGQDLYAALVTAHETSIEDGGSGITQFDYKIQCTDAQYQKLTFTATQKSVWKERPDIIADIKEKWEAIAKNITKAIAKPISPANFAEIMNDSGIEEEEDVIDVTDTGKYYEEE